MDSRLANLLERIGRRPGRVMVCAHRGDRANAPENTISAFASAIALGVECIEFDIHLSRDNGVFVIHDDDVERCSDGKGRIRDRDRRAIERLDAGSWFNPRFRGERVPTLDQALETMRGKAVPVIEIKRDKHGYSFEIEELLYEKLADHNLLYDAIIISFDGAIITRLHEMDGTLLLGAIGRNDPVYLPKWVQGWHPPISEITEERVSLAHDLGHWVLPWNANDQATMKQMIEWGADILGTDHPEILLRFLRDLDEYDMAPKE